MSEDTHEERLPATDPAFWEEALGGHGNAGWLLQDPQIEAAIRGGRPHALYRLLQRRRPAAPSVSAGKALDGVLSNRRYFLQAMRGTPGLSTLNGIGTRVYGEQEKDPQDGTYITTQFFTLVFLPLWPLAQYLVAKAPSKGWYFLGRVPLSSFYRWWRRAVLVAAGSALVAFGTAAWRSSTHSNVHFLNGLPVPVAVTMGDEIVRLAPGGRETREMQEGRRHVTARLEDGRVIEERDVDVPGDKDLVAYNVLGSAPLVLEIVPYTADGVDPSRSEHLAQAKSLAGNSWVVRDPVDFVFQPMPAQISMGKNETVVTRKRAALYEGDWRTTAMHLTSEQRAQEAATLARAAARVVPENEEALGLASHLCEQAGGLQDALSFFEELIASWPDEVPVHRHYQEVMRRLDRSDEILDRYQAAYEADQGSARAAYLYARLASQEAALGIYEALLPDHPDDPWLLRGAAWVYCQTGRFADALPLHQKLLALRPQEAGYLVGMVAQELVAVGRVREALEAVGDILDAAPRRVARGEDALAGGNAWALLGLYARLRRLAPDTAGVPSVAERWRPLLDGTPVPPQLLAETGACARDAALLDPARGVPIEPESRRYCELSVLSQVDLDKAASLALETEAGTLQRLEDEVQLAIACELDRTGHAAEAEHVLAGLSPQVAQVVGMDDVRALPDVDGLSEDLEPMHRAALLVAASRRVEDDTRREALLAEARRLDVLRIVCPE
jgi:tetratricopeptide (TPR) repeat protein